MAGPWERYAAPVAETGPWAKYAAPEQAESGGVVQFLKNSAAGLVRGAGSLGASILDEARSLGDAATDATPKAMRPAVTAGNAEAPRSKEMRAGMDAGLKTLGADPESLAFKGGKLTAEVAGSAGAGGLVAELAGAAGAAPALVNAVRTGGMSGGGNALTRAAGGAINGATSAGLVSPEDAGLGAMVGGAFPGALKAGSAVMDGAANALNKGMTGSANRLMQAAIKPTLAQRATGEADTAIQTLLDYGISPTKAGVNKLQELIGDLNTKIAGAIDSSPATVSKQAVINRLGEVRGKFSNQVSPTADLNAIQSVADDFSAHPSIVGDAIPVKQAQQLKQGTYKVLAGKYGEAGSAATEGQKGLARGLKEEIAAAVPEVSALNAEESRLLTTLGVAERRALLEANKNPMGLAALASNPLSWAAFMADRSSAFKALAARMVNRAAPTGIPANPLLSGPRPLNALGMAVTRGAPVMATQD